MKSSPQCATQTLAASHFGVSRDRLKRMLGRGAPTVDGTRINLACFRAWMVLNPDLVNPPRHSRRLPRLGGIDQRPGVIYGIRAEGSRDYRYIGKTGSFKQRINQHRRELRRGGSRNPHLQRWHDSISGRIVIEVLQECLPGTIDACEQEWIARGREKGWKLCNITEGGDSAAWSDERRDAFRKMMAGKNQQLAQSAKWREAMRAVWGGKGRAWQAA
jgi:hypothetical protein